MKIRALAGFCPDLEKHRPWPSLSRPTNLNSISLPETFYLGRKICKFLGLPWNVIENKGREMRKMRQMRHAWNVYENK